VSGGRGPAAPPAAPAAAPPPEPLPAPAFDSHCHLDMIERPVGQVLDEARQAGITRVITVGCDLPSSRWAVRCAAEQPGVYAAVAIHPNETARAVADGADRDAVLAEIAGLAASPLVRAVGETGLDYYRDSAPPQVQRDWFRAHIEIAKRSGKPLMIHDRDAHTDVLSILADEGPPEQVIFHCFSGGAALAKKCAEAGYLLSFAGTVTFGNAQRLREAAAAVPAEQILVETDAPFLTPVPNRGKSNTPAQVAHTLRAVAEVRQMSTEALCAAVTATGERVFGPWPQ
jgi:TatD DNase family protein